MTNGKKLGVTSVPVGRVVPHSWLIFCGQCYETFYGRNLRLFIISYKVVPGKPFQPSLMLSGKAGAYPSEARCYTLG